MPDIDKKLLTELEELRKYLHKHPELSHQEKNTAKTLKDFLQKKNPNLQFVENIGGYGMLCIHDSGNKGPFSVFRADLDALPIEEINQFDHISKNKGVGHKCGHDGHSTILAGLGSYVADNPPEKGKIGLLFQPAEETGEGARNMLNDSKFKKFSPDYYFGLHNLPGYEKGTLILKDGIFASASTGMEVKLKGHTSHAGHPENGISPNFAVSQLMQELPALPAQKVPFERAALVTIIHVVLGEIAYGTSPGYSELRATIRSHTDEDMKIITEAARATIKGIAEAHNLKHELAWKEDFPSTKNDSEVFANIRRLWEKMNFPVHFREQPFPWSEDFGNFLHQKPGMFFGLGSGNDCPQLHNPDYDFPDEITEHGIRAFAAILSEYHN